LANAVASGRLAPLAQHTRRTRRVGRKSFMILATMLQLGGAGGGFGGLLIPLGLMFGIMYLMVIMPQQKQRKKMQEMLSALKTGDKVVTNGGIYGTVSGIDGDSLILKISAEPPVKIRILRSAIAQVEASEDAK
jgi:preprotein translocase subunit YajC